MKVRLYSYGGSGLKFLTNHLRSLGIDSYDEAHNPHQQYTINSIDKSVDRVIYLYSNPINAFLSFWRRTENDLRWINLHLSHLESNRRITESMETYIMNGNKFPELEDHFNSWYKGDINVPIAYVRYEDLQHDSVENDLKKFLCFEGNLGISSSFKKRNSAEENMPIEISKKVNDMFNDLIESQKVLPSIYIKNLN